MNHGNKKLFTGSHSWLYPFSGVHSQSPRGTHLDDHELQAVRLLASKFRNTPHVQYVILSWAQCVTLDLLSFSCHDLSRKQLDLTLAPQDPCKISFFSLSPLLITPVIFHPHLKHSLFFCSALLVVSLIHFY